MLLAMPCLGKALRRRLGLAAIGAVWLCAGAADAERRERRDETERWVPSFSIRSGVTTTTASGSVDSFVVPFPIPGGDPDTRVEVPTLRVYGTNDPAPPAQFGGDDVPAVPRASGSELVMNPWTGGSIEIMTPGLAELPTRPRFFVHGDYQRYFGPTRSIVKAGNRRPPRRSACLRISGSRPASSTHRFLRHSRASRLRASRTRSPSRARSSSPPRR